VNAFDDISREDSGPPKQDERLFAYLNRSDRIEAHRVRLNFDDWLSHYPEDKRQSLISRFRSPINDQHLSAFFELFLHEFLLRRKCKIIAIEPTLAHTSKSPDFLVESIAGERFYLEAVIATGRSDEVTKATSRLNTALAAIDAIECPSHFLDLTVRGMPTAPITIRKLKHELRSWIASLPVGEQSKDMSPFKYDEHGAKIRLRAWPRQNKNTSGRAIGARFSSGWEAASFPGLRSSIEGKASRYGNLDHPYVVAVNLVDHFFYEINMLDILLGSARTEIFLAADGTAVERNSREKDGVWMRPRGPSKTGLSAVLTLKSIDPWNFASRNALLIRNPTARAVLPAMDFGIDELVEQGGQYQRIDGARMGAILGLPENWPEE